MLFLVFRLEILGDIARPVGWRAGGIALLLGGRRPIHEGREGDTALATGFWRRLGSHEALKCPFGSCAASNSG